MVQPFFAFAGRHFLVASRDGGRPKNVICFRRFVIKEFRRPTIMSFRLVHHHGNSLLLTPMNQITGRSISDDPVRPTGSPDHVKCSVGSLAYTGITHQFIFTDRRSQKRASAVQRSPVQPIITVGKMQTVLAVIDKIRKEISSLTCKDCHYRPKS